MSSFNSILYLYFVAPANLKKKTKLNCRKKSQEREQVIKAVSKQIGTKTHGRDDTEAILRGGVSSRQLFVLEDLMVLSGDPAWHTLNTVQLCLFKSQILEMIIFSSLVASSPICILHGFCHAVQQALLQTAWFSLIFWMSFTNTIALMHFSKIKITPRWHGHAK